MYQVGKLYDHWTKGTGYEYHKMGLRMRNLWRRQDLLEEADRLLPGAVYTAERYWKRT